MSKLKIAGFVNDSITDGPGLRFVIFTQGCPHKCDGCHNPQTHSFEAGNYVEIDDLFLMIEKNVLLTGVTFSGGEPVCQAKELIPLAKKIKANHLELAIYSGYTFEELIKMNNEYVNELLSFCDILVDGKFVKELKSLNFKFKGSANQRVIDLPKSLHQKTAVLDQSGRWE